MITITKFAVEPTEEEAIREITKYGIGYAMAFGFPTEDRARDYIENSLKHNRPSDWKDWSIYKVDLVLGFSSVTATKVG
jgi:hypothetical protein